MNSKYTSTFGLRSEHNNYDGNKDTYIGRAMSSNAHAWAHLKKNIVYNDGNGRVTQARGIEKKSIEYKYHRNTS